MEIVLLIAFTVFAIIFGLGTIGFLLWAADHFLRKFLRRQQRRHLYVLVDGEVSRIGKHSDCITLHVSHSHAGQDYATRVLTVPGVADIVSPPCQFPLLIDPDRPLDVIVDPDFEAETPSAIHC